MAYTNRVKLKSKQYNALSRDRAVRKLVGLITRRSLVQIQLPQPERSWAPAQFFYVKRRPSGYIEAERRYNHVFGSWFKSNSRNQKRSWVTCPIFLCKEATFGIYRKGHGDFEQYTNYYFDSQFDSQKFRKIFIKPFKKTRLPSLFYLCPLIFQYAFCSSHIMFRS